MFNIVWIIHIGLCVFLVILVMLQHGKGADAGAITSGSGADSILGAGGAGNVLTRVTTGLAIAFMFTSIILVKSYNSRSIKVADSKTSDTLTGSVMEEGAPADKGAKSENEAKDVNDKTAPAAPGGKSPKAEGKTDAAKKAPEPKAAAAAKKVDAKVDVKKTGGEKKAKAPVADKKTDNVAPGAPAGK
jgi:preprotein translocase subunit SecG